MQEWRNIDSQRRKARAHKALESGDIQREAARLSAWLAMSKIGQELCESGDFRPMTGEQLSDMVIRLLSDNTIIIRTSNEGRAKRLSRDAAATVAFEKDIER